MTEKLYENNFYQRRTDATLIRADFYGDKTRLIFDRTIFFPTGGGQPCDTGMAGKYHIIDAYEDDNGDVVHITCDIASANEAADILNTKLNLVIDWERRFMNMQRHLGEHMLTAAFHNLYDGANKGFHMSEDFITIDIELPEGGIMNDEMVLNAEAVANKTIYENLPVHVDYFNNADEASHMPSRKDINNDMHLEGIVSVITIGDKDKPYDCVPCCGTHPSSTGEIGIIKVYKHEPNKGMTRIFFDAGMKAFERCRRDMDILTEISDNFSCGQEDLIQRISVKERKENKLRDSISKLSAYITDKESKNIASDIRNAKKCGLFEYNLESLDADHALRLGFAAFSNIAGYELIDSVLLALIANEGKTVLLLSNGMLDCGDIVKKKAHNFGGKGGGRPNNARAAFKNKSEAEAFLIELRTEYKA